MSNEKQPEKLSDERLKFVKSLVDHALALRKKGSKFEAYFYTWTVIENFLLPELVSFIVARLKLEPVGNDFFTVQAIKRYYLLSHDKELYNKLMQAKKKRDDLIHRMHKRESIEDFEKLADKAGPSNLKIITDILNRLSGHTPIPSLELYRKGWNDAAETIARAIEKRD